MAARQALLHSTSSGDRPRFEKRRGAPISLYKAMDTDNGCDDAVGEVIENVNGKCGD